MGLASLACVLPIQSTETSADLPPACRIALGPRLADYLGAIILPVLACFEDHDSKLRYFAIESMYNIVPPSPHSSTTRD